MPAEEATKGNSEIALIERITARLGVRPGVARWSGDDATGALGRDTAEVGDLCCVTGTVGAAAAGLMLVEDPSLGVGVPEAEGLIAAHRRPTPRLAAGRALATPGGAAAMLDCSDGLALDAGRI